MNLLPPLSYHCKNENKSRHVPTDSFYSDLDQDGIPEFSIGRIPAGTPEELETALEKIRAYEQSTTFTPTSRRIFIQAGLGRYDTSSENKFMGKLLESSLEQWGRKIIDQWVSYRFDVEAIFSISSISVV